MHILLIEDDLDLGRALQSALKVEGLTSEWLRRTVDAPATVDATTIDCVLLDLTLPDGSGFDLLARWSAQMGDGGQVPIIVITARSAVEDRLAGLDGGADDFVIKPFATAELMSRIRAVLRRSARQASERAVSSGLHSGHDTRRGHDHRGGRGGASAVPREEAGVWHLCIAPQQLALATGQDAGVTRSGLGCQRRQQWVRGGRARAAALHARCQLGERHGREPEIRGKTKMLSG